MDSLYGSAVFVGVLTITALLLQALLVVLHKAWCTRKLPTAPGWIPVLGHIAVFFRRDQHSFFRTTRQALPFPTLKLWLLNTLFIETVDKELIQAVTQGDFKHKLDKDTTVLAGSLHETATNSGEPGVFSMPTDDRWSAVRKSIAPAFSFQNLSSFVPYLVNDTHHIADVLTERGALGDVDVDDLGLRLSLDLSARVSFGMDFRARDMNTVPEFGMAAAVTRDWHRRNLMEPWRGLVPRGWVASYRRWWARLGALVDRLAGEAASAMDGKSTSFIFNALAGVTHPTTGARLSRDQLQAHVGTVFFAGLDTTGHTLGAVLYLLAAHPQQQAALRQELVAAGMGSSPGGARVEPGFEAVKALPYLAACILEAMRLIPVSQGIVREIKSPFEYKGVTMPAGAMFWIHMHSLCYDESTFPDANMFKPERWLETQADGSQACSLFSKRKLQLPSFGLGIRNCVGMNMAKVELLVIVAILVSRFKLEPHPSMGSVADVQADEVADVTISHTRGLHVIMTPSC